MEWRFRIMEYHISFCNPFTFVDLREKQCTNCEFEIGLILYQTLRTIEFNIVKLKSFNFLVEVAIEIDTLNKPSIQKEFNDIYCHNIWLHEYFIFQVQSLLHYWCYFALINFALHFPNWLTKTSVLFVFSYNMINIKLIQSHVNENLNVGHIRLDIRYYHN